MGGNPDAALGVDQYRPVDDDPSPFRAHQPGDHIDDRGLARSRAAEQCGETAPAAKMDIELEGAEPVLDIHLEDRAHSGATIQKTYNLEAGAGVGAPCRNNGVDGPRVLNCAGWFRLRGGDNEGQNRILRALKL
jgi:hypothetical protein